MHRQPVAHESARLEHLYLEPPQPCAAIYKLLSHGLQARLFFHVLALSGPGPCTGFASKLGSCWPSFAKRCRQFNITGRLLRCEAHLEHEA